MPVGRPSINHLLQTVLVDVGAAVEEEEVPFGQQYTTTHRLAEVAVCAVPGIRPVQWTMIDVHPVTLPLSDPVSLALLHPVPAR